MKKELPGLQEIVLTFTGLDICAMVFTTMIKIAEKDFSGFEPVLAMAILAITGAIWIRRQPGHEDTLR
jgi:hypothetical protein